MNEEKAIIKTGETRIAPWGERAELREIARRVQIMAPGGKKLNEGEALALAQGAVAHGLDPFNGEIWYIPGSGLMAGIKGLRKAARAQISGNFWPEFLEITSPEERKSLMIPDGALAFRCIIRDSDTIRAYSDAWKELAQNGVPVDMIPQVLGRRPYVEGIGYLRQGEKTKMDPVQCAMKRAEADALKRRFDLPFAVPSEPSENVLDAEWALTEPEVKAPGLSEETKADGEAMWPSAPVPASEAAPIERPYSPTVVLAKVTDWAEKYESTRESASVEQKGLAIGMLEMCFAGEANSREKRHSVQAYLTGCEETKDIGGGYWLAILKWLHPSRDSGGAYAPEGLAVREAQGIVGARMIQLGQTELPLQGGAGV